MILSFFKKDPALDAASALYAAAVEQARAPALYADLGAPDTIEGRFEQVTLHVYLILRRLKGGDQAAKRAAQKLFDVMFQNMDDSLRELGVGDLSIGKKIRKMAENFYGRVGAYEDALAAPAGAAAATPEGSPEPSMEPFARALGRNVFGDEAAPGAVPLARYARAVAARIDEQPVARIAGGVVRFPDAAALVASLMKDAGPPEEADRDAGRAGADVDAAGGPR